MAYFNFLDKLYLSLSNPTSFYFISFSCFDSLMLFYSARLVYEWDSDSLFYNFSTLSLSLYSYLLSLCYLSTLSTFFSYCLRSFTDGFLVNSSLNFSTCLSNSDILDLLAESASSSFLESPSDFPFPPFCGSLALASRVDTFELNPSFSDYKLLMILFIYSICFAYSSFFWAAC